MTLRRACAAVTVVLAFAACGTAPAVSDVETSLDGGAPQDGGCSPGDDCGLDAASACDRASECRPYSLGGACASDAECPASGAPCSSPECIDGRCFQFWSPDGAKCDAQGTSTCVGGQCVTQACAQKDGGC